MTRIRLLTSIADGPCEGAVGDEVDVPSEVADVWADGVRAERVTTRAGRTADVETTARSGGPETAARRTSPRRESR